MDYSVFYLVIILLAVTLISGITIYAWRYRHVSNALAFFGLMLCVTVWGWAFIAALFLAGTWLGDVFWNLSLTNVTGFPVLWFIFAMVYTGRKSFLTLWLRIAISIIPTLNIVLLWTNSLHHLFFQELSLEREGLVSLHGWTPGIGFWIHTYYSYVLILVGIYLVARMVIRNFYVYRLQAVLLLIGVFAPLFASLPSAFGWTSLPTTFIGFAITGVAFSQAIFRYQFLDLRPIARDVIIENMQDGMMVLDQQSRIVDVNLAMRAIMGVSPEHTVVGVRADKVLQHYPDIVTEFRDTSFAHTELALERGGLIRHYDMRLSPLTDKRGTMTGRLVVLRDITEHKLTEQALRRYTVELEASNAELDAFAHTVAHDLKTPLAALIGFGLLLERRHQQMTPEQLDERLGYVSQAGYKMTNIVEELLLLASVRKAEEIDIHTLDMAEIVLSVLERLRDPMAKTKAEVILPETWPSALGYAPWIEEVWVNYVSNALKYGACPDEGLPPRVELGFDEVPQGVNRPNAPVAIVPGTSDAVPAVRFWCRDHGPGLTPEAQSLLFVEFTRLEQTRAQGHGFGLSIVQRIVKKLGGEVGVESQVGHGSTFWFTLPGSG